MQNNLWKPTCLATEAHSDSFEFICAIQISLMCACMWKRTLISQPFNQCRQRCPTVVCRSSWWQRQGRRDWTTRNRWSPRRQGRSWKTRWSRTAGCQGTARTAWTRRPAWSTRHQGIQRFISGFLLLFWVMYAVFRKEDTLRYLLDTLTSLNAEFRWFRHVSELPTEALTGMRISHIPTLVKEQSPRCVSALSV